MRYCPFEHFYYTIDRRFEARVASDATLDVGWKSARPAQHAKQAAEAGYTSLLLASS
jgi:hypothetical protein